ncbi:MAG: prepilin-type N-terminal cleavage/methylation domain-containing protein [Phycisphaerales bacterium]
MARTARSAFSLIELVIVVVIIGIIAAIAIPRMSRGAAGAADASLQSNLRQLRNGIDLFYTEHDNVFPDDGTIAAQLTTFTKIDGTANATRTTDFIYGPYIREIPALPVGSKKGQVGIAAATGASVGWIYIEATGTITANTTTEQDARGVLYSTY